MNLNQLRLCHEQPELTKRRVNGKLAEELNLVALIEAFEDVIIGKTREGKVVSWNKGTICSVTKTLRNERSTTGWPSDL